MTLLHAIYTAQNAGKHSGNIISRKQQRELPVRKETVWLENRLCGVQGEGAGPAKAGGMRLRQFTDIIPQYHIKSKEFSVNSCLQNG